MEELGKLASQLGYWVVYRNWYRKVSFLIYRWDEQLPIWGPSFPTAEEAFKFLTPISSQPRELVKTSIRNTPVEVGGFGP